jgi:hypothetical protein
MALASIILGSRLSSTALAHVMGHGDAITTERKYSHLFD